MTTLMKFLMVAVAAPSLALVQDPPRPPVPAKVARPVVPPLPAEPLDVRIRAKIDRELPILFDYKLDEMRIHLEDLRSHEVQQALEAAARVQLDFQPEIRIALEHARTEMQQNEREMQRATVEAERAMQRAQLESERNVQRAQVESERALQRAKLDMERSLGVARASEDRLGSAGPRAPWAQEDPADSLYREGREALNRGEYRRAATAFADVVKRFPKSQYALDSQYWEAFARYRVGTTDDLKQAQKLLEDPKLAGLRQNERTVDVAALRARVLAALAGRGDAAAARAIQSEANQVTTCDREDVTVKAEALSALAQMDITAAIPVAQKTLARRDDCTVELRRRALWVLGRQPTPETIRTMFDVAKNDTDQGVRREAMTWLSRGAGDQSIPMFEELLKTSTDEQTQRSAVNALGSMDTDRARKAIRAIIERTDVLERVRMEAINSMARDRDNRSMSADDMAYLRSLYAKVESQRLKESVLSAVSRSESPENEAWLLGIAKNESESSTLRARALDRLGRMTTVSFAEIGKLYENADSRALRQQILRALSERKEPEAIDKLVEVARRDTDPNIRTYAIQILTRSNNPKALQGIKALVDTP